MVAITRHESALRINKALDYIKSNTVGDREAAKALKLNMQYITMARALIGSVSPHKERYMDQGLLDKCTKYLEENGVSVKAAIRTHQGTKMNRYYFETAGKRMGRDGKKYAGRRKEVKTNYRAMSLPFSQWGRLVNN